VSGASTDGGGGGALLVNVQAMPAIATAAGIKSQRLSAVHRARPGSRAAIDPDIVSAVTSRSSTAISDMTCTRRSGSFCRHRRMIFSRSRGRLLASWLGGIGSLARTAASVDIVDFSLNTRTPVTISYRTAPKLKMSDRASTCLPSACSGDI
jgi:hypothetical protein